MDLPVDAIEEILRRLDGCLCSVVQVHPRLAKICERIALTRLEIRHVCITLQRSVANNTLNLRVLILTDCDSKSSDLSSLIRKCPNLTELSTVNSGLRTGHLMECLESLRRLESLSFRSVVHWRNAEFPINNSIRKIYVEYEINTFWFVVDLVNSCHQLQKLHILAHRSPNDFTGGRLFPLVSSTVWSNL